MSLLPPIINIFEKAAKKAGKILIRDFGEIENLQIQSKNIENFVTNTDYKTKKTLLETLQYYYPECSYISKAKDEIKNKNEIIIINPINGKANFIHGIPLIAIDISKVVDNEITDSVIFNPITNELFWASKGKGAWCNNKRLRVSKRNKMKECIIGKSIPNADRTYNYYFLYHFTFNASI